MKAQGILILGLGPFLARMLSARESEFDHETSSHVVSEASRKKSWENDIPHTKRGDTPTMPGVAIRSAEDAAKAQFSQPAMVNPRPVPALLMMLRNRRPRSNRIPWRELSLPPGCVLAVRYMSR